MLALDYGSARTGVAVSDPTGTVARPADDGRACRHRHRVCNAARRDRRGRAGARRRRAAADAARWRTASRPQETQAFVERLRAAVDSPVETYDERFTSVLAGGDDARAAAHLLTSYLEWQSSRR